MAMSLSILIGGFVAGTAIFTAGSYVADLFRSAPSRKPAGQAKNETKKSMSADADMSLLPLGRNPAAIDSSVISMTLFLGRDPTEAMEVKAMMGPHYRFGRTF